MESQREVHTEYILKQLARHNQLFVPVSNFLDGTMQHIPFEPGDILALNSYHIPEPIHKKPPIHPIELDVIFIPLLQADVHGNRLGYGKGFYDRYLALCRPDVIKIGLNFFEPISAIPTEKTDIPLDYLITPDRVYEFK
jgi:5-formyltetrahydrofolate cyclo-ligase